MENKNASNEDITTLQISHRVNDIIGEIFSYISSDIYNLDPSIYTKMLHEINLPSDTITYLFDTAMEQDGAVPLFREYTNEVYQLPIHPMITDQDVHDIISTNDDKKNRIIAIGALFDSMSENMKPFIKWFYSYLENKENEEKINKLLNSVTKIFIDSISQSISYPISELEML